MECLDVADRSSARSKSAGASKRGRNGRSRHDRSADCRYGLGDNDCSRRNSNWNKSATANTKFVSNKSPAACPSAVQSLARAADLVAAKIICDAAVSIKITHYTCHGRLVHPRRRGRETSVFLCLPVQSRLSVQCRRQRLFSKRPCSSSSRRQSCRRSRPASLPCIRVCSDLRTSCFRKMLT